jgi:hypothetical protein
MLRQTCLTQRASQHLDAFSSRNLAQDQVTWTPLRQSQAIITYFSRPHQARLQVFTPSEWHCHDTGSQMCGRFAGGDLDHVTRQPEDTRQCE